ncbi:MAG: DUF3987 domain-containing protein [Hymenobacter sp.]|nr:MAG: DUF3987 domain-containing protein [Hymenobacter sp.]
MLVAERRCVVVNPYATKVVFGPATAMTPLQAQLCALPTSHLIPARPTPARSGALGEGKGSLPWCLEHFAGGSFPQSGSLEVRVRWLSGFATLCAQKEVYISHINEYTRTKCTNRDLGTEKALDITRRAYAEIRQLQEEANQAKQDALIAATKQAALLRQWPIPQPLASVLLPVMAFDEKLFPAPLRRALADTANRLQCPPEYIATAMLASAGGLIGARCGIYPKQHDTSWTEVPNLWGAVVGEPSKMKTPAINAGMSFLYKLEQEAQKVYSKAAMAHEAEAEVLKARKDALKGQLKVAAKEDDQDRLAEITMALASLGNGAAPSPRRYVVNDSTVEKLTELLGEDSWGLFVFRDELTGLLQTWEKPGHENDRAFYLEAWSGTKGYTSDRIGRGTTRVNHCCVSLFGGIQPDKIAPYLAQSLRGQNDGLLQRFQLLTWPDSQPYKYVDTAPDAEAQAQAIELFRRLDQLDFVALGATLQEGDTIPCFHFSPEAQAYFVQWLNDWEKRLARSTDSPALIQHLAKYRKLFPALALLLHLLDLAAGHITGTVSLSAIEKAAQWCAFLETHARRLYAYRAGAAGSTTALVAKLLDKSITEPFKVREIVRKGWQGLTDTKVVEAAVEELVDTSWLREVPTTTIAATPSKAGRPPASTYQINPRIYLAD